MKALTYIEHGKFALTPKPKYVLPNLHGRTGPDLTGGNMTLKERAASLKKDIPAVFLALKAKETPVPAKIAAFLTVAYALSPIDLVPDFIPVLGYLDDVILLPALVALTVKLIPRDVFARYRQEAEGMWQDGRPKKWYYSIPIVLLWLLILWAILKAFL